MDTGAKNWDDFILSNYPRKVTVGDVKGWLADTDRKAKGEIIDFIYHRLHHRYLVPLSYIPREYKSGFLMMASACLMIETIEAFRNGLKETPDGKARETFKAFFEREKDLFPGLAADATNFYRKVRCGILHQAETKGGYRILRGGQLFDAPNKTIDANKFIRALTKALDRYVGELRKSHDDSSLWQNVLKKVKFISENCQN
jgi:hypothetical protein